MSRPGCRDPGGMLSLLSWGRAEHVANRQRHSYRGQFPWLHDAPCAGLGLFPSTLHGGRVWPLLKPRDPPRAPANAAPEPQRTSVQSPARPLPRTACRGFLVSAASRRKAPLSRKAKSLPRLTPPLVPLPWCPSGRRRLSQRTHPLSFPSPSQADPTLPSQRSSAFPCSHGALHSEPNTPSRCSTSEDPNNSSFPGFRFALFGVFLQDGMNLLDPLEQSTPRGVPCPAESRLLLPEPGSLKRGVDRAGSL